MVVMIELIRTTVTNAPVKAPIPAQMSMVRGMASSMGTPAFTMSDGPTNAETPIIAPTVRSKFRVVNGTRKAIAAIAVTALVVRSALSVDSV